MKIAFIADSLPPSTDGVARTYTNLVETLQNKDVEFCFISPFKPGKEVTWADKVLPVHYVPFPLYSHYRLGLPVMQRLQNKLDTFKPDIIHASSPTFMGQMAVNYARRRHVPAVAVYHTDFVSYFKYYGFKRVEKFGWSFLRWFYNQFYQTLAPSQSVARLLENKGFTNVSLWQRGIDIARFSPNLRNDELRKRYAPKNESLLLFVGRLVKEKDLQDLVAINEYLIKKRLCFKFVLVGDGPMKSDLQQQLPDAIFTGYLHGKELSEMYASCDLFVFPSTTETFGNVILEALASGLPVVTVDKGGVADLVDNDLDGYVCKANHPGLLAEKIIAVLSDEARKSKFSDYGREYAAGYSWEAINTRLLNLYQQLVNSHSDPLNDI